MRREPARFPANFETSAGTWEWHVECVVGSSRARLLIWKLILLINHDLNAMGKTQCQFILLKSHSACPDTPVLHTG